MCILIHLPGWTMRRSVQHLQFLDHHPCCFDCGLAVLISSRLHLEEVWVNIVIYLDFFKNLSFGDFCFTEKHL